MIAVDHAKSRSNSPNFADIPLMNESDGEASTTAPTVTSAAVSSCATAIRPTTERTRGPDQAEQDRAVAMPTRNRTRMIVNTYVELPVPAPMRRFQTTW